jgi:N-acyl-D-amino-acid deacylase
MAIDICIRGGVIVDGSGGKPQIGDIGIEGDRIVAVEQGHLNATAATDIDASGCIVTPGFIDPHTHLDAQLFWDSAATPSCFHGVTTVTLSACGFGVAPCAEGEEDTVLRRLELVEEISHSVTRIGVPISWGSWLEYRSALSELSLGVNVAGFVPHSALRSAVLGDRAKASSLSDDEIKSLAQPLEEALAAGAVGLSTSRLPSHRELDGTPMSSCLATDDELSALVALCDDRAWQIAVRSEMVDDTDDLIAELDLYTALTANSRARLSWAPLFITPGSDAWRVVLRYCQQKQKSGIEIVPQVMPVAMTVTFCLANDGSYRAQRVVGWGEVMRAFPHGGTLAARLEHMRRADVRDGLRSAGYAGGLELLAPRFDRWRVAFSPSEPDKSGMTLEEVFDGHPDPVGSLIDLLIADDLQTIIEIPVANQDEDQVAELAGADGVLLGLGDSGAHLSSITSYRYPTVVLSSLVRERGEMTVQDGVARLTSIPAKHLGLRDRGEIRRGYAADVCVIDLQELKLAPPEYRNDLPGGAGRMFQGAHGYRCVLVNGAVSIERDALVQGHQGKVLSAS